jgi:hypothetical protein
MVEVAMGTQQMNGLELLLFDIVDDSLSLFWEEGTAIDDNTLLRVIAYHIGVFLKGIENKCLNVEHRHLYG